MKKIYTLVLSFVLLGFGASKAQDTLLFEPFELTSFYNHLDSVVITPGNATDTMWYSADLDNHPDASTGGGRPMGWFPIQAISVVDQYQTIYGTTSAPDTNTCLAVNSWTNLGDSQPEDNWLVTPSVQLGAHDTLFWKSAPSQTPRYLDGYEVVLSTGTNDITDFTHQLFRASEMVGSPATDPDTVYADFTFAPLASTGAFIHGLDGTYIDPAGTTSPISHHGRLHPQSAPLDAYANQKVFIGFHHNSADDNLLSLDDVMIRGSAPAGIKENNSVIGLSVYPNPAKETSNITFSLAAESTVTVNIYDITGQLVYSENKASMSQGYHMSSINTSLLAKGFYSVAVQTNAGRSTVKLIVQ